MGIITSVLSQIKSKASSLLGSSEKVNQVFKDAGHTWRKRLMDPAATIELFLLQILNGNTAITHLTHLSGKEVDPGSYCQARARLPVAGVASLVESVCGDCVKEGAPDRVWRGHRLLITDGSSVTASDKPNLQELWPQPCQQLEGIGFPKIKLLGLLDVETGMVVQMSVMSLETHEMSQVSGLSSAIRPGDVVVADRGLSSYWHFAELAKREAFGVFRTHQKQIVDFTPNRPHRQKGKKKGVKQPAGLPTSRFVKRLGHEDHLVEYVRPARRPDWMTERQYEQTPETIQVREIRYRIKAKGMRTRAITITTTLLDPVKYPKKEIARIYGLRWDIETNFRHMKTTMKMETLKCQTVDGVLKELMMFVLVYNLIRAAMTLAADRQGIGPSRISFIDALRRLCSICNQPAVTAPIDLKVNPRRPGRWHPRVIKRRKKEYDLMTKPRAKYAKPPENEVIFV